MKVSIFWVLSEFCRALETEEFQFVNLDMMGFESSQKREASGDVGYLHTGL